MHRSIYWLHPFSRYLLPILYKAILKEHKYLTVYQSGKKNLHHLSILIVHLKKELVSKKYVSNTVRHFSIISFITTCLYHILAFYLSEKLKLLSLKYLWRNLKIKAFGDKKAKNILCHCHSHEANVISKAHFTNVAIA